MVTYGCEIWTLLKKDEEDLNIFKRDILRKIFGPIREQDGTYRARTNFENETLINKEDIMRFMKSQRIKWFRHIYKVSF